LYLFLTNKQTFFVVRITCVTFNDIPNQSNTSGIIPNGYKNLNWANAEYINILTMPTKSGYRVNGLSSPFVAHSPTGDNITITTASGTKFSFYNVTMTSAWRAHLNITVSLITDGWSLPIPSLLSSTSPAVMNCQTCPKITKIIFEVQDETSQNSLAQNGTQFIIDRLCISFEP
jgi:hypothetical protein